MMIYRNLFFLFLITSFSFAQNNIESINIKGLKRTKESFIKKIISLKTGDVLDSTYLRNDIKRLKRMELVAFADFTVSKTENNYAVEYNIVENFTIIPGFGIYTTNQEEVAYRVSLFDFNFLGRNHIAGGFFLHDVFDSYGIYYEAPFLFNKKWGLSINHINTKSFEPVFFENNTANYKYQNNSIELKAIYQPNFYNRIEFGGQYFTESYSFINAEIPSEIRLLNVKENQFAVKTLYNYTNLDKNYQYINGIEYKTILQFISGEEDELNSFFLGRVEFKYFKRVSDKGNFASRLQGYYATNNNSPFAPFVVDNNINIRGVGNTIDRGTAGVVFNTEFRYTLFEKGWFVLQGNTFVDTGVWRTPGGDFKQLIDGSTLRLHPGLGIRFIHKRIFNAAIRVDYGLGITNEQAKGFVIGIGQYF